jgi:SNF2 family DNA or RNA helicase
MAYRLRQYQADAATQIAEFPDLYLIWDMGLGKTLTTLAGLSLADLPALIVAPLRVAKYVWPQEVRDHGLPFTVQVVHGKDRQDVYVDPRTVRDLTVINPEGLDWLTSRLTLNRAVPWRTLIVDEAQQYKDPGSLRWKRLKAISQHVPKTVLLSGTPCPSGLQDLWAQFDLFRVNPLGPSYEGFLDRYFEFDPFGNPVAKPESRSQIGVAISHLVNRKQITEEIDMPELTEQIIRFDIGAAARKIYKETDLGMGEASDLDAYTPLRTIASGFVYHTLTDGRRIGRFVHNEKEKSLLEIVTGLGGDPALILFNFRHERLRLMELLTAAGLDPMYIDGGSRPQDEDLAIAAWNRGELKALLLHPRSAGHGLNLQSGGRHVICYGPTDSAELHNQAIARLYRSGQSRPVIVHRLIAAGTIEEPIMRVVSRKDATQADVLREVKLWQR